MYFRRSHCITTCSRYFITSSCPGNAGKLSSIGIPPKATSCLGTFVLTNIKQNLYYFTFKSTSLLNRHCISCLGLYAFMFTSTPHSTIFQLWTYVLLVEETRVRGKENRLVTCKLYTVP